MDDDRCFPFAIETDETLEPGTIKILAAETHIIRLHADESAEYIAGPLDGLRVRTTG
jgi:hypothetical protein